LGDHPARACNPIRDIADPEEIAAREHGAFARCLHRDLHALAPAKPDRVVGSTSTVGMPAISDSTGSRSASRSPTSIASSLSTPNAWSMVKPPVPVLRNAREVRAAAHRLADVLGQHADVRALAAADRHDRVGRGPIEQVDGCDVDAARLARDLAAGARMLVISASLELELPEYMGGSGSCSPRNRPRNLRARRHGKCQLASRTAHTAPSASPVVVVTRNGPSRRMPWAATRQGPLRELGRLAEAEGSQPDARRVERARVARLLRAVQALGNLQRRVRRDADRLVEQENAVDAAARDARRVRDYSVGKFLVGRDRRRR
jgi:hypothetical protein